MTDIENFTSSKAKANMKSVKSVIGLDTYQKTILKYFISTIKAILGDILEAIDKPENTLKLEAARNSAGNDMIKMMQYMFPVIVQIQMEVIKNYGFPEGREGMVHFSQLIRNLEREDSDVAELHSKIRMHFLPPVNINTEASL